MKYSFLFANVLCRKFTATILWSTSSFLDTFGKVSLIFYKFVLHFVTILFSINVTSTTDKENVHAVFKEFFTNSENRQFRVLWLFQLFMKRELSNIFKKAIRRKMNNTQKSYSLLCREMLKLYYTIEEMSIKFSIYNSIFF